MILFIWEIMRGRLMATGLLKPFINIPENRCNGFFQRDARW